MQVLEFVAFSGLSFFPSKIIEYTTRSKFATHIAYRHPDSRLIEAWNHGNGWKTWWDWSDFGAHTPGTPYEIWQLPVQDVVEQYCRDTFVKWAAERQPYDVKGLAGFVFKFINHSKKGRFCSEGCIEPLAKILQWNRVQPHVVHPDMFIQLIQTAGANLFYSGKVGDGVDPYN